MTERRPQPSFDPRGEQFAGAMAHGFGRRADQREILPLERRARHRTEADQRDIAGNVEPKVRQRVESLGCPPPKIQKLPVGLDPAEFPFHERGLNPGEPLRILTVGRLVEIKGHEHVIRAVHQLSQRQWSIHYDIVGDGPTRPIGRRPRVGRFARRR